MRYFIFFALLFFFFTPYEGVGQRNTLKETKTNIIQKDYKKILLVGKGPLETRVFLEILTSHLIDKLKSRNIQAEYKYFGKDTSANNKITQSSNQEFDAVIVFSPMDSLINPSISYNKRSNYLAPYVGVGNYNTYSRTIDYAETFDVQLFDSLDQVTSIWNVSLDVDCDFSKKKNISSISKLIINSLKINKIIK
jgi:hypothetical protein